MAKDTLVEKAATGTDGTCVFVSDLPLGQYYVKEIKAPKGYVLNEEVFKLDASYQGDDVKVIDFLAEFSNYPTKLEISKTDITREHELKDATLSIIDKDGNVVETWKSDGTPHVITRIPVGEYTLREETAPYGYKIANEVKFTVENTKELQKVVMKDELVNGKIIIEKTDADTGKGIAGVAFVALLKQANTDSSKMAEVIGVSEAQLRFVTNTQSGMGLMKCGNVVIPFDNQIEKGTDLYNLYNTNIHEKIALEKSKNAS